MKETKPVGRLGIKSIVEELEKTEKSAASRKGAFKIDASFEEALKKILKAKPEKKKANKRGRI